MPRSVRLALAALTLICALGLAATALAQAQQRRVFLPMLVTTGSAGGGESPLLTGEATYYTTANGDGNCMFGPSPDNLMVAALSYQNYYDPGPAAWCGAYAEVTGPNGTILVRIVDQCPDRYTPPPNVSGCGKNHLDLSPQAFDRIAERRLGRVPISWRVVSPPLDGPIAYHFKDGSNQWWTAVQVRNHRNPIATLEYRDAAGQWVGVPRTDYNFFVRESGMGPGPYTFRVTDIYGNVLIDSGIPHTENGTVPGAAQLPPGP